MHMFRFINSKHTTSWDVVNCHMVAMKNGGKTAAPVMLCVLQVPKTEARLAPKFKHAASHTIMSSEPTSFCGGHCTALPWPAAGCAGHDWLRKTLLPALWVALRCEYRPVELALPCA